jgi:ribosome-associated toxin RatA of RatAB toxin-antitoxin module
VIEVALIKNLSSIDLQIHFYFKDENTHAMNADVFNNCQRQFINALKRADAYFDEPLLIEVTAREEGGAN